MISQLDFGAGYVGNFTIPANCTRMVIYENGPGAGGAGGNTAVTGSIPAYVTSVGQFNLGSACGMDGTARLYGLGGDQGDSGGGGQGGWWNANGSAGIGGYVHVEFYVD